MTWVICPLEKSNTSSLSSLRMIMLFWHRLSLVRLAPTMSLMNVGQCLGHSCFRIYNAKHTHQRVSNTAQKIKITACSLPYLENIARSCYLRRANNILKDSSHPAHHLFTLLPSGRRYRSSRARTTRLKDSFFFPHRPSELRHAPNNGISL